MLDILIHGGNRKQRSLVKRAINHSIDVMMPSLRTLRLEVELKEMIDYGSVQQKAGYNTLYMELNKKQQFDQLLETTMHEMVHVKQSITKDWTTYYTKCFWKGVDYTDTYYSQQPWERQAFRMQSKLVKSYNKKFKSK